MDKSQTPPPGAPVIDLTDMVESGEQAAQPEPKPVLDKDLGELDRILAELSAQSPPPARDDDMEKLMAEMGLQPQPQASAPTPDEGELQDLLQELGGKEQAGAGEGQDQGTGDPELDDLLSQLGSQGRPEDKQAAKAPEAAEPGDEVPSLAEPEELVELVRMAVRQILEDEAPEMVSRLVAQELEERLEVMVGQELEKQLKARVTQEVKDLLRKAMSKAGRSSGKRDDGAVVD
ncbi:MAG: hypothetical protein K9K65_18375 [Desulfarculaceae bacterium]|nr:hypothetical protein [Desulfarculaceae bacterium]MCF8049387.1 hypothetical protein [Desulfarculaceae bacterium]MCF8066452.1 hypothetical protein [Desulfarculaceae bacterium]MCF8099811.1 hypothetical protein [Desulfarculaceae bacterium]MCF8121085.1 hypothetical protein [Desulfarculaceae bacterium]